MYIMMKMKVENIKSYFQFKWIFSKKDPSSLKLQVEGVGKKRLCQYKAVIQRQET